MKKILICLLGLSISSYGSIPLKDLTQADVEALVGEFAGSFNHTTVTSASSLGKIFGFQLGLVGGLTKTETLKNLVSASGIQSSRSWDSIPTAALTGKVSTPFGLSAEASLIPSFNFQGLKVKNVGLGLSYDIGSALGIPLVGFGLKGSYTNTDFGFRTNVNGTTYDTDFSAKTTAVGLFVHKKFIIVEPYIGFGYITTDGELDATASLFQFTASDSVDAHNSSSHFVMGANLNLLAFKFGAEYSKLLGTSKVVGKLNFGF